MMNKLFIDSNVWVYLFVNENNKKSKAAEQFILNNESNSILVISYQVINEVSRILIKNNFSELTIQNIIKKLTTSCVVQNFSENTIFLASQFRQQYSISFWDSHILACAVTANCNLLVSEDMQDGFTVNKTTIKNIFN